MRFVASLTAVVAFCGSVATSCPDGEKIKVTVAVIFASTKEKAVDPRLKALAAEIGKQNPQFTGFKLHEMTCRSLSPKTKTEFKLPEGQKVLVTVKHGADDGNRVGLSVTAPNQGEIEYRTVCGKFLPLITRYETTNKERLILAIRVQPCNGD